MRTGPASTRRGRSDRRHPVTRSVHGTGAMTRTSWSRARASNWSRLYGASVSCPGRGYRLVIARMRIEPSESRLPEPAAGMETGGTPQSGRDTVVAPGELARPWEAQEHAALGPTRHGPCPLGAAPGTDKWGY